MLVAAGLGWLCLDLWRAVTRTASPTFDLLLGAVAASGACAGVVWSAFVVVVVALGSVPGRLGVIAMGVARAVAPAAARRRARVALGLAVTAAQVGLVVSAAGAAPAPASAAASPAMATLSAGSAVADLPPIGRPPVPPPAVVVPPDLHPEPQPPAPKPDESATDKSRSREPAPDELPADRPARVTVEPGDTLWAIAADHLGGAATAKVAAAWPLWFAANRDVIGADPDLIRPGMVLVEPAPRTTLD